MIPNRIQAMMHIAFYGSPFILGSRLTGTPGWGCPKAVVLAWIGPRTES
jgi:hypothetical protein